MDKGSGTKRLFLVFYCVLWAFAKISAAKVSSCSPILVFVSPLCRILTIVDFMFWRWPVTIVSSLFSWDFGMYAMINASNLIDYVPMVLMLAGCGILGFILLSFWLHRSWSTPSLVVLCNKAPIFTLDFSSFFYLTCCFCCTLAFAHFSYQTSVVSYFHDLFRDQHLMVFSTLC